MELQKADWKDVSTALSATSLILAGIGASLPSPFDKIVMGASVGLANAAIITLRHGTPNPLPESKPQ